MKQTPRRLRMKWTKDLQNLLLALSLALTLLLFWGPPLLNSLERPSVQGVLEQRQLELQALASQVVGREIFVVPSGRNAPLLRRQLFGADPLQELADVLQQRQDTAATADRDLQLRRVLIHVGPHGVHAGVQLLLASLHLCAQPVHAAHGHGRGRWNKLDRRFDELKEQRREDMDKIDKQFGEVKAEIRELRALVQEALKART